MYLPEPATVETELPPINDLEDWGRCGGGSFRSVGDRGDKRLTNTRGNQINLAGPATPPAERRDGGEFRHRKRQRIDRYNGVAAGGIRADRTAVVNVQAHSGAPSGARCQVGGRRERRIDRVHRDGKVEAGHPLHCLVQHLSFELPLVLNAHMPELGAARALRGCALDGCLDPRVRTTMLRCAQHLHGVRSPVPGVPGIVNLGKHPFAGDRICHKDDPTIVPRNRDTAVRDAFDLKLNLGAGFGRSTCRCRGAPALSRAGWCHTFEHGIGGPVGQDWHMRLYLASTSPARLSLLRAAGIEPITISPGVDETAAVTAHEAVNGPLAPAELVQFLAQAKAEAIAGTRVDDEPIDGLILGGDSAFEFEGTLYGKPHTAAAATERWRAQRGRSGQLWSGHWLIDHRGGSVQGGTGRVAVATVRFADVHDAEIDAYVASGEPLAVAGAFTVDSLGGPFIREVVGDPSTVVGLSLSTLRDLVAEFGIEWPSLWNRRGAL